MSETATKIEWWTVRECANRWRVGQSTIIRHIASGALAAKKIGKSWRIHRTAVDAFERDGIPKQAVNRPAVDMSEFDTAEDYTAA